jgi:hypothetical protein
LVDAPEGDEGEETAGGASELSARPSAWERMLEELGGGDDPAGDDGLEALHASIAERIRTSARSPAIERSRDASLRAARRRRR